MAFVMVKNNSGEEQRGLIFSEEQWTNLNYKVHKAELEARAAKQKLEDLENRKKLSREITNEWDNTVVKMRKKRFEMRHERMMEIERKVQERFEKMRKEQDVLREERQKKAEKELYEQKDSSKSLAAALRLAEVLKVRELQREFDKKLKEKEEEMKTKYEQQILDDVREYKNEQDRKKRLIFDQQLKMKGEAQKAFVENQERKDKERNERLLEERNDLIKALKELESIEEAEKQEKESRKQKMWDDIYENKKRIQEQQFLRAEESDEENTAIHLVSEAKKRISMIRHQKELEIQAAGIARRDKLREKLAAIVEDRDAREDAIFKRANDERDALTLERLKRENEHKEKLAQERRDAYKEYKLQEAEKKAKEKELFKWEFIQKFKAEEVDKQFKKMIFERELKKINLNKESWNKQIEEKCAIQAMEKEKEEKELKEHWNEEDKAFFEYAERTLDDCKKHGRPIYPLEKCLQEYKKKNGLDRKKSTHSIFISKVPVAHPEQKEALVSGHSGCQGNPKFTPMESGRYESEGSQIKNAEVVSRRTNNVNDAKTIRRNGLQ